MSGPLSSTTANAIRITATRIFNRGVVSNLFVGGGIAYALYGNDTPKYEQTVLAYAFPSAYVGYHTFVCANAEYKKSQASERAAELAKLEKNRKQQEP